MGFNFLSKNIEVYKLPPEVVQGQGVHSLLKGVQVIAAGYFPEAKGHNLRRDPIDDTVVIYCTAGKGYFKHEDKIWQVSAGDILHCYRGVAHRYYADKENPWTIYWFHLRGREVDLILRQMGVSKSSPKRFVGLESDLIQNFRVLLNVLKHGYSLQNSIYVSSLARQILCAEIFYSQQPETIQNRVPKLKDVLNYMAEHLEEQISVAELAKICNLSVPYFIRVFKKQYDYSPIEYLNRLKIQKACNYLMGSESSIKEISYLLGFSDPLYFSRLFQKIMSKSPKEFRNSNQI